MMGLPVIETPVSYFNDSLIEVMKQNGRGTKGHIGFAVNDIDAAEKWFAERGLEVNEESRALLPDGSTKRVLPNLESSAELYNDFLSFGFDAVCSFGRPRAEMIYTGKYKRISQIFLRKLIPQLKTLCLDYPEVMKHCFAPEDSWENVYPNIMPQWDRSPRAGNMDGVFVNATPENFKKHILQAWKLSRTRSPSTRFSSFAPGTSGERATMLSPTNSMGTDSLMPSTRRSGNNTVSTEHQFLHTQG